MTQLSTWSPCSSDSNIVGQAEGQHSTPTICTIVVSRKSQSSVSYAEANQVKLIHAQRDRERREAEADHSRRVTWSSTSAWASSSAATPKAMTKVRSKSSSSGVEARLLFVRVAAAPSGARCAGALRHGAESRIETCSDG